MRGHTRTHSLTTRYTVSVHDAFLPVVFNARLSMRGAAKRRSAGLKNTTEEPTTFRNVNDHQGATHELSHRQARPRGRTRCRLRGSGVRTDHLAALIASGAEISTLSRNIHHLTSLLRQGAFRAAQEYRPMLDTLADDLRGHLELAAGALAELRPRSGSAHASRNPSS